MLKENIGEINLGLGRAKGEESAPPAESEAQRALRKDAEVEDFITATGVRRWLAKLVFRENIDLIYNSESKVQFS